MVEKITLTFISDPGHGWLRVPHELLKASGYKPTEYSFYDKDYAYLEEDVDANEFLKLHTPDDFRIIEQYKERQPRYVYFTP